MQILRIREVVSRTGLSRSSIYEQVKRGEFPAPLRLDQRARGWLESEIDAWIKSRERV
ncbi:helix-turn-helix transcriptional regulator [Salinisphaera japonica]|uniref:helix-turn-helix transcriptional regulator n=1 Tax=Salinisphaera japonica TaxID=1304270 RepID=UPI000F4D194F|nr:AlpA family phage regulatory protein [Salinisphaera japonica]